MRRIVLVAHNLRSAHNVGSLLRTADGLGAEHVYLTGYTPYPILADDTRLPHLAKKLDAQIHKTALGAEKSLSIVHSDDIQKVFNDLRSQKYTIYALEQSNESHPLPRFNTANNIALVIGREVEGLEVEVLGSVDSVVEIPMLGDKESFNVVQAAAMALYHFRYLALHDSVK
ncbi:MAG TPA: TrmH family RNA methyltransferase [Patescibacteria group bacterium]|nr:TrmH family RNA methyltransferase [Patescibacteria group bacterium]